MGLLLVGRCPYLCPKNRGGENEKVSSALEVKMDLHNLVWIVIQARIAQLVAHRLGTTEVMGLNPGKGEFLLVKLLA